MNCLECQELLQQRLDGESVPDPHELERHLAACQSCSEQHDAATRLLEGLRVLPRPESPPDFAQRLVTYVLDDRRRRRRRARLRWVVTTAMAASLLIVALSGYFLLPRPKAPDAHPDHPVVQDDKKHEPAPEIAKSLDDARGAVASLTERFAEQTRKQTQILLAAANPMDVTPLVNASPLPEGLDPTPTLKQAGQGLSEGLEPVTRSTRRALEFLVREVGSLEAGGQ